MREPQRAPQRRSRQPDDRKPGLLRRALTSNIMFGLLAMVLLGYGALHFEVGRSEPPANAESIQSANEYWGDLLGHPDMTKIAANAIAAANRRAYEREQAIIKKAKADRAFYLKNKKKLDAAAAAAKLAKLPNPSSAQNEAVGKQLNALRGWSSCWPSLLTMWTHESNWNERADNPYSDAYGIPQALPGSKMGPGWQTNATNQIKWGLGYIGARYGDPCKAWAFWQSHHWY
ncbi:MAG: lytic transglycosylase domain-containing protein [Streptosporangiaceae bacterium]